MVAGHLQEKNDFYYIVLSYKDADGKRKTKWEATGLSVKRNKKKAEALLLERRRNFMVPTAPAEIRLDDDILFSDFMLNGWKLRKALSKSRPMPAIRGWWSASSLLISASAASSW